MTRAPPTGSTGDAPDVDGVGHSLGPIHEMPTAVVEQYGDLHEYGLSLGVDLDADGDEDLAWGVQQAFNAPLPGSWTEYMDDTGRAYYIKDGSTESTWEHPMDAVHRELLALIKRQRSAAEPEAQREEVVKQHLKQVHQRAKADLASWSGPYHSEQGDYYFNDTLKLSTWESPVIQWEQELALRHRVLARYLLPEQVAAAGARGLSEDSGDSHHLLQALRLQLGNLHFNPGGGQVGDAIPEPSTSRSFHTARSQGSSRNGRNKHSPSDSTHRERKERKSGHRHHRRSSEERKADREGRHSGSGDRAHLEPVAAEAHAG